MKLNFTTQLDCNLIQTMLRDTIELFKYILHEESLRKPRNMLLVVQVS